MPRLLDNTYGNTPIWLLAMLALVRVPSAHHASTSDRVFVSPGARVVATAIAPYAASASVSVGGESGVATNCPHTSPRLSPVKNDTDGGAGAATAADTPSAGDRPVALCPSSSSATPHTDMDPCMGPSPGRLRVMHAEDEAGSGRENEDCVVGLAEVEPAAW